MMNDDEPLHIIMADDNENDRDFFREALGDIKVKTVVTFVNDGSQLMDHLNSPENRMPHVVFIDLNMPSKDGMECLSEIRKDNKLKDLIVVIYSADAADDKVEEAFIRGANIYIQKPNDLTTMKNSLSQVINLNWQYHTLGLKKENFLLKV
jgi:CheY-like chemotaxis protein